MYVLMVVPSNFPNGDAGAVRDMAFAKIYQELGYEVYLIGAGKTGKKGEYNGVHYYSIYKEVNNLKDYLLKVLSLSRDYMALVRKIMVERETPAIIHINSIPEVTIGKLIRISKDNNIPLLHDSTEWYSPCDLAEHFKSRGLKSIRIPVIMDVLNTNTSVTADNKVRLIYAGSPANKDYLREIVLGVIDLNKDQQEQLELHILGATEEQVKKLTCVDELPKCIILYGRVPREKVEEVMLEMDFSALLRPSEERYTKAGFPTKSIEAMSHGVAMICNLSSDLGMYLKDGENAIIVDGYDEKSFTRSLERVLTMSRSEIDSIKHNARLLAEEVFDYRNWIKTVSEFIGEI